MIDPAEALERIFGSRCGPRMTHALLWAATAGVSYRESCTRADLAPSRARDLQRTAHRLGLRELHLLRKSERCDHYARAIFEQVEKLQRAQADAQQSTPRIASRSPLY